MEKESIRSEFVEYIQFLWQYLSKRLFKVFRHFEKSKDFVVDALYQKRGKYAQPFLHSSMVGLMFVGVTFGPLVLSEQAQADELSEGTLPNAVVLGATTDTTDQQFVTSSGQGVLDFRGGEIVDYEVREGDTLGSIAEKFNLQLNTVLWANDLTEKSKIKQGQTIKIPPVDGVVHTVKKGETIYSIAKKYGLEGEAGAQGIVNYPFNTFTDDETFGIAVGQSVMVPDGVVQSPTYIATGISSISPTTPNAGVVSAVGSFVWPASGRISQGYKFYHRAIDIASKGGGPILAADAGRVTVAGWPDSGGYGNRVVVDHGNGYITLYAHLSVVRVVVGQTVNRGDIIGDMGTTGRSTGVHLHFEIRQNGVLQNPLSFLR